MKFGGREIDAVRLWENYVDFPVRLDADGPYLPKVVCPNPNHDTFKHHFQINQQDGLVHCFAECGISGSFQHALCVIEGLYDKYKVEDAECICTPKLRKNCEYHRRKRRAYRDARKIIFKYATGAARPKFPRPASIPNDVSSSESIDTISLGYETYLPPVALEYLRERKINAGSISAWELGWLPEEQRIVIPAQDLDGHLRFLIKRAVFEKQNPKYLYTEGFPKTSLLFGACRIDREMIRSFGLILTEGSLDAIRIHQNGFVVACAILGTGISESQRRIISRFRPRRIYFMFDKDASGIRNIEIASRRLRKYPIYICRYPRNCSDPAELSRREVVRSIERAEPFLKFVRRLESMGINIRPNATRYKEKLYG